MKEMLNKKEGKKRGMSRVGGREKLESSSRLSTHDSGTFYYDALCLEHAFPWGLEVTHRGAPPS